MQKYICDKCGADMGDMCDVHFYAAFGFADYELTEHLQLCDSCNRRLKRRLRRWWAAYVDTLKGRDKG